MTHTPGPWIAIRQKGKYEGNYNIGRTEDHGKGLLLTFVSIYGPNDFCPPEYAAAAKANANLIVAAPDLLEICRQLIEEIYECAEYLDSSLVKLIENAENIVAKAGNDR